MLTARVRYELKAPLNEFIDVLSGDYDCVKLITTILFHTMENSDVSIDEDGNAVLTSNIRIADVLARMETLGDDIESAMDEKRKFTNELLKNIPITELPGFNRKKV